MRRSLKRLLQLSIAILLAKTLIWTVAEYPRYWPADFESNFLAGRERTFFGWYAAAFYTHILCGPVAIVAGSILWYSGRTAIYGKMHRHLGRVLAGVVLLGLIPSGIVMASRTFGGIVAQFAFYAHAVALAFALVASIRNAQARRFFDHQLWAERTLLLLIGPLLLRIAGGAMQVLDVQSPVWYQANTWLSWIVPLLVYEVARLHGTGISQRMNCALKESR